MPIPPTPDKMHVPSLTEHDAREPEPETVGFKVQNEP